MKKFFGTEGPTVASNVEIKHPKAAQDVKLVENQRNIQSSMMIPESIIVFKDPQRMPQKKLKEACDFSTLATQKTSLQSAT